MVAHITHLALFLLISTKWQPPQGKLPLGSVSKRDENPVSYDKTKIGPCTKKRELFQSWIQYLRTTLHAEDL